MRSYLLIALFSFSCFAAPTPKPVLEVEVHGHYSNTATAVFSKNGAWWCKTDLMPHYTARKKPFNEKNLAELHKLTGKQMSGSECRDQVSIQDNTQGNSSLFLGCAENSPFKEFLALLNDNCRP